MTPEQTPDYTAVANQINQLRAAKGYKPIPVTGTADSTLVAAYNHAKDNGYWNDADAPAATNSPTSPNPYPEPLDYNKAWSEYQSGEKPLLHAIMSNYTKPVQEITPEQAQKAKFGAAMTDTFSSLAEMFAHGQGARIRNNTGPSNQQTTNARLRQYQDKYDQEMKQYGSINANAELQDFNHKIEMDRLNNQEKRQYYLNKQQQEARQAALERQIAKDKADAELKKRGLDIQEAGQKNTADYHNKSLSIEQQKANKDKTEKFSGIVINAHPSDPNAKVDATGNRVIPYHLTKPEIQNLAGTAQADKEFMQHPDYKDKIMVDKADMFGTVRKGLTSDEELARMYRQYQYDKQFAPQQPAAPPQVQWKLPVIQNAGGQKGTGKKKIQGF